MHLSNNLPGNLICVIGRQFSGFLLVTEIFGIGVISPMPHVPWESAFF